MLQESTGVFKLFGMKGFCPNGVYIKCVWFKSVNCLSCKGIKSIWCKGCLV